MKSPVGDYKGDIIMTVVVMQSQVGAVRGTQSHCRVFEKQ